MPTQIAVITGDINGSSYLDVTSTQKLGTILMACYEELCTSLPAAKGSDFTTFLGDSWQFRVNNPSLAVRAALFFRARLLIHGDTVIGKKLHSSAAIGFGSINSRTGIATTSGEDAFALSGKKLAKLRRRTPGLGVAGSEEIIIYFDSLLGLFDALLRRWTITQAKVLSFALSGAYSQIEIAEMLNPSISQQAVNKHLHVAGWPAIKPALQLIETTLEVGQNK